MAWVTIRLSKDVIESFLNSSLNIRWETRQIASDSLFGHQILQNPTTAGAEWSTIVMLWYPIQTNESIRMNIFWV